MASGSASAAAAGAASVNVARGYLLRYRLFAFTTATLLIVLVFVGIPLQFAAHRAGVVNVVGTMHGFLYLGYLFVAFQLTRRLGVPKWQMLLVLLAGTVPFCAFVAERKLTRRYDAALPHPNDTTRLGDGFDDAPGWRTRWLSRRALLLDLEVLVVAPGCAAAGWWQATRALAGNTLSWVYSVEWPIFAVLALWGWWYLIHEDPEAYRARRQTVPSAAGSVPPPIATVEAATARLATGLALLTVLELALGVATLVAVPFGRPSGWEPTEGAPIYLLHGAIGLPLAIGALTFLTRTTRGPRLSRLTGKVGAWGIAIAALGGLATPLHPLRMLGAALMLVGTFVAAFGYLFPVLERSRD